MSDSAIKEIEGICNKKRNDITKQEKEKYKARADDGFVYILNDLALKIIINCRVSKRIKFETKQGFSRHDLILTKEQSVLKKY